MKDLTQLLEALDAKRRAASPGPYRGDRLDGTIKYDMLSASGNPIIHGDHGNEENGPYGFMTAEDEAYFLALDPDTVGALIDCVRAASWMEHPSPALQMALAALASHLGTKE